MNKKGPVLGLDLLLSASLRVVDDGLRDLLLTLSPSARDKLRRALILDEPDRDAVASELLRFGDANGDGWADLIDTLTMYPDVRREVVRLPAEIDAAS